MKNKFGLFDSDMETIRVVLSQHLKVEKAIIFGSRAKGNFSNGSDIDLALKGANLDFATICQISYQLNEETNLPYRFDILNYHTLQEPDLIDHIDRMGIELFSGGKSLRVLNQDQYKIINEFLKKHINSLKKTECNHSKEIECDCSIRTGYPISNYIDYNPNQLSPKFFVAASNIFKAIIFDNNYLSEIAKENPEYFGTGDAKDVLKGIIQYDENFQINYKERIGEFGSLLTKATSYVIKVEGNLIHPEVLKIDLFRCLKKSIKNSSKFDFIGGLFHSFKHFSIILRRRWFAKLYEGILVLA